MDNVGEFLKICQVTSEGVCVAAHPGLNYWVWTCTSLNDIIIWNIRITFQLHGRESLACLTSHNLMYSPSVTVDRESIETLISLIADHI